MAAQTVQVVLLIYLVVGVFFAVTFVIWLIARIDSTATHTPLGFRLIIVPGCVALWPVLLFKVLRNRGEP